MAVVKVDSIVYEGARGEFRANREQIGWRRDDGGLIVVKKTSLVKKAEWLDGKLRLLCANDDGNGETVLAFDRFPANTYDAVWRLFFEQSRSVYVQKHNSTTTINESDFDRAVAAIERAADRVDEALTGGVLKGTLEAELMQHIDVVLDELDRAIEGDKQALDRMFAANGCERIGRLRLVVDTVQIEVCRQDPRWLHLLCICRTIESVLRDLGTFCKWRPDKEQAALSRRYLMRGLTKKQHFFDEDESVESLDGKKRADRNEDANPLSNLITRGRMISPGPRPYDWALDAKVDELIADPNAMRADPDWGYSFTRRDRVVEGWLWKKSRFLGRWRRRWLVLGLDQCSSYKNRNHFAPTEIIKTGSILRVYDADFEVGQARSFCIVTSKRNYYMVCDHDDERKQWIAEFRNSEKS
jgi:hypothetical protein